jgi:hypothetical protein
MVLDSADRTDVEHAERGPVDELELNGRVVRDIDPHRGTAPHSPIVTP